MEANVFVFGNDEAISRRLAAMLRQEGYAVRYFPCVSHLEQASLQTPPDLLILNAVKNGSVPVSMSDLAKAAAASLAPILVLASSDGLEEVMLALGERPAEYYTNPVLHYDLAAKVRALIGAPGANGYASSLHAPPEDRMKLW
jgi:DNA-binding response OmpR family regulator